MRPADAQRLQAGDLVSARYLGKTRWARVTATTALRVYLTTADVPPYMYPLALEWVRPEILTNVVLRAGAPAPSPVPTLTWTPRTLR